ncbi:MAG: hypothetical protein ABIA04_10075 [Pseudomonadota bacterium]
MGSKRSKKSEVAPLVNGLFKGEAPYITDSEHTLGNSSQPTRGANAKIDINERPKAF